MLRNIVAVEYDGRETMALSISFEVPDNEFDLVVAARKAATDFCKTEAGKAIYEYNCSCFNWADFEMSVPNSFCEKYGFRKVDSVLNDIIVDWDEHVVDDFDFGDDE